MSATYVEIKNLRLDVHEDKEYNFILPSLFPPSNWYCTIPKGNLYVKKVPLYGKKEVNDLFAQTFRHCTYQQNKHTETETKKARITNAAIQQE